MIPQADCIGNYLVEHSLQNRFPEKESNSYYGDRKLTGILSYV